MSLDSIIKSETVLGEGTTAIVYKGYYRTTGMPVAVKRYRSEKKDRKLIHREIENLKKLENHVNVIKILDLKETDSNAYMVLEYCNGDSIENFIKKELQYQAGLTVDKFHKAILDISAGYKHLHDNHLAHRDIKPDNIMIMNNPDGTVSYKIGDLGSSKEVVDDALNDPTKKLNTIVGKEEYMDTFILERYIKRINNNMDGKITMPAALRNITKSKKEKHAETVEIESYNKNVDLWSLGCTFIYLACNCLAFSCPSNVKNSLNMILQMHEQRRDNHIMSTVVSATQIENSSDFRATAPMNRTAARELQEYYKKVIRYCFRDAAKRKTDEYFELIKKIRESTLCYKVDLTQGFGYYDMQESQVGPDIKMFKVLAVNQLADRLKPGVPIVFLSSSEENCVLKKPVTSQLKANLTHMSNREILFSQCQSFESGYSNFDKIMMDLRLLDQLALICMSRDHYRHYADTFQQLYANHRKVHASRREVLDIWDELKPLEGKIDPADSLSKVAPAFVEKLKDSNARIKQQIVGLVTVVCGNESQNKRGFVSDFCKLLLGEVVDLTQLKFMIERI